MCKIIQLPNLNRISASTKEPITKKLALEKIEQLSWEDPEAFFILEANSLSYWPVEMDNGVKEKLEELNLINDSGQPHVIVRQIMQSIAARTDMMVSVM